MFVCTKNLFSVKLIDLLVTTWTNFVVYVGRLGLDFFVNCYTPFKHRVPVLSPEEKCRFWTATKRQFSLQWTGLRL